MEETKKDPNKRGLTGKWFHSFHDNGEIMWQGQVLSSEGDTYFLVQLYSFVDCSPVDQKLISFKEMAGWSFYETDYKMRYNYYKLERRLKDFEANDEFLNQMNKFYSETRLESNEWVKAMLTVRQKAFYLTYLNVGNFLLLFRQLITGFSELIMFNYKQISTPLLHIPPKSPIGSKVP